MIYLAGKVNGNKNNLAANLNSRRKHPVKFSSSDGSDHSEHLWGFGTYEFDDDHLKAHVLFEAIGQIEECDYMIAYLDTPDSFGSIAEIAYASSLGKDVYMIIKVEDYYPEDETLHKSGMYDAYWFVSNFPHVYAITVADDNKQRVFDTVAQAESPIEHKLIYAMMKNGMVRECTAQLEIDNYRIDFAFEKQKLAVELDGHEYHKTKEQRTRDSKRDRKLTSLGWSVIRFTGSEIHENVIQCRDEIRQMLDGIDGRTRNEQATD